MPWSLGWPNETLTHKDPWPWPWSSSFFQVKGIIFEFLQIQGKGWRVKKFKDISRVILEIPWTSRQGLSRNDDSKSRVELLKYPKILGNPWKTSKILENSPKSLKILDKVWKYLEKNQNSLKILEKFQVVNIKIYQGFFKVQPWRASNFQGKDKVRFSRNLIFVSRFER